MTDFDVGRHKAELIAGGFRPQRFSFLVNKVRRVLWPFSRPYHFFTLDVIGNIAARLAEVEHQIGAARQQPVPEVERLAQVTLQVERLTADVEHLLFVNSKLRTEVAAAVNRHLALEGEMDRRLATFGSTIEQAEHSANELRRALDGVRRALDEAEKSVINAQQKIDSLDLRTRLSLAYTQYGLIFVKRGEYISDVLAREGTWDPHIAAVIEQVADKRAGTALDIGAHIGFLSIVMGRRFGRVVSFEPNTFNYAMLAANVALTGLSNVRCVNGAVFSRPADLSLGAQGQQEIALPLKSEGEFNGVEAENLGAYLFTEAGSGLFRTRAVTIDSLKLDDVAFIKIDVQGADGEVIQGAKETIRRCRPVIVFEWEALLTRNFGVSLDEVQSLLSSEGYQTDVLKIHNEKQTDYIARPAA